MGVFYIIWKVFESTFQNRFRLYPFILQTNSWTSFYTKSLILYNNRFVLPCSTNKSFYQISNLFSNFWPKTENSEAWILIKVQYQWICLDKLYKLMESLFQISFWNFGQKPKNILTVFKQIAGLRFYTISLMLYINGFVSLSSTN